MPDVKRIVSTGFWTDDKVLDNFTSEDKLFMLYLLTGPYTTQLGIYHIPIKSAAVQIGISEEAFKIMLRRFQNVHDIIKWSEETNEIAIKNYLVHSIVKGGEPVLKLLIKEEKKVKDKSLLEYVKNALNEHYGELNQTVEDFLALTKKAQIQPKEEVVTVQTVVDLFNEICVSFPKVTRISKGRRDAVNARMKSYTLGDFKEAFRKAENSDFLKGRNNKNWSANFDWIIKDSSIAKVLDGNYDNKKVVQDDRLSAPYSAKEFYGGLI